MGTAPNQESGMTGASAQVIWGVAIFEKTLYSRCFPWSVFSLANAFYTKVILDFTTSFSVVS